nr:NAD(P)/FAD-dependent oxidoreductase [Hoyosella altamirensis]
MVTHTPVPDHDVIVVGAGFSGIGAAIKLDQEGFDYLVVEASDGVGGTWHLNTYPGVAVDIPSFSYAFSFEQGHRWSRTYAPGSELKAYAERCVTKYGLRPNIRLSTKIASAEFDESSDRWRLVTDAGEEMTSRFVIYAVGPFSEPQTPDIPGIESFAGTVMHTARWDHSQDLTGRRVAIIGTGASAVQVIPAIAPEVERLTVFQRTPIWVLPRVDLPLSRAAHLALDKLPLVRRAARLASQAVVETTFVVAAQYNRTLPMLAGSGSHAGRRFLQREVKDPVVRKKLTPNYPLGCKRPSFSNTYLAAFNRPNVLLETDSIAKVTPGGIITVDGTEHEFDTLILATGFKLFGPGGMPSFRISGKGGADLATWWEENRYQAYQGASVPGFPNVFTILGPYAYNGSSYFELIENQLRHIIRCLKTAEKRGATRVEISEEANTEYFEAMIGRRERQIFFNQDCSNANSYYFDPNGDVPFRSATTLHSRWASGHFSIDHYEFTHREPSPA